MYPVFDAGLLALNRQCRIQSLTVLRLLLTFITLQGLTNSEAMLPNFHGISQGRGPLGYNHTHKSKPTVSYDKCWLPPQLGCWLGL